MVATNAVVAKGKGIVVRGKYVVEESVRHHRHPIVSVRGYQMTDAVLYQRVRVVRNAVEESVSGNVQGVKSVMQHHRHVSQVV